jgi:hypothetical protein
MNQENKNLGACAACGGTVSKKAKTCPHCGQKKPFKRGPTQIPKPIAWGVIILVVISGLGMISNPPPPSSSGSGSGVNLSDPAKQQNWILTSQDGVRNRLKDPGSAKFKDSYFLVWNDTPVVCGWVNSKNSMGGYGGFQRFVAAGESIAYLEEDVADFHNVWNEMCQK